MKFATTFPASFVQLTGRQTLAYYDYGGVKLLVKLVSTWDQALLCGGFLILNTTSGDTMVAEGQAARQIVDARVLPCQVRLEIEVEDVSSPTTVQLGGQRAVPFYRFTPCADSDNWLVFAVITTNMTGFGLSGLPADRHQWSRPANKTWNTGGGPISNWIGAPNDNSIGGNPASIADVIQLSPIIGRRNVDSWRMLNMNTFNGSSGSGVSEVRVPQRFLWPTGLAEIGLIVWPKTLLRTWQDGRAQIKARTGDDAADYFDEAWDLVLPTVADDTLPYVIMRGAWQGVAFRGRDPREADGSLGMTAYGLDSAQFEAAEYGLMKTGSAGLSDMGLSAAHYTVARNYDAAGNKVYLGARAKSSIGAILPCCHNVHISHFVTGVDNTYGRAVTFANGMLVAVKPVPAVAPYGKFMGVEAGAALAHLWPADFYDDAGEPRHVIGNDFEFTKSQLVTILVRDVALVEATTWPGIPTDPTQLALAVAENHAAFRRNYGGNVQEFDDVATEQWARSVIRGLADAAERLCDKIGDVAEERGE